MIQLLATILHACTIGFGLVAAYKVFFSQQSNRSDQDYLRRRFGESPGDPLLVELARRQSVYALLVLAGACWLLRFALLSIGA